LIVDEFVDKIFKLDQIEKIDSEKKLKTPGFKSITIDLFGILTLEFDELIIVKGLIDQSVFNLSLPLIELDGREGLKSWQMHSFDPEKV
jgi:hypothetical protein